MTKEELESKLKQVIGDILVEYDTDNATYNVDFSLYKLDKTNNYSGKRYDVVIFFNDDYEPIKDE